MTWRVAIERLNYSDAVGMLIFRDHPEMAKRTVVKSWVMETEEEGLCYEGRETFRARRHEFDGLAQALITALWEQGYRPAGVADSSETLAATRAHLDDMRALVAKSTDATLPARK